MSAAPTPTRSSWARGGVVGWNKTPTTADVHSGIVAAITAAMKAGGVDRADINCVMIETTQFTNAVIARRALLPVGIVRLALPATSAIPPLADWPTGPRIWSTRSGAT